MPVFNDSIEQDFVPEQKAKIQTLTMPLFFKLSFFSIVMLFWRVLVLMSMLFFIPVLIGIFAIAFLRISSLMPTLFIGFVLLYLSIIAYNTLMIMTKDYVTTKKPSLTEAISGGIATSFKTLCFFVVYGVLFYGFVKLIIAVPALQNKIAVISILVIIFILSMVFMMYALPAVVLSDVPILESPAYAFNMFKHNIWRTILCVIIIFLVGTGFYLGASMLMQLFSAAIYMAAMNFMFSVQMGMGLAIGGVLLILAASLIIYTIYTSIFYCSYTVMFLLAEGTVFASYQGEEEPMNPGGLNDSQPLTGEQELLAAIKTQTIPSVEGKDAFKADAGDITETEGEMPTIVVDLQNSQGNDMERLMQAASKKMKELEEDDSLEQTIKLSDTDLNMTLRVEEADKELLDKEILFSGGKKKPDAQPEPKKPVAPQPPQGTLPPQPPAPPAPPKKKDDNLF